MVAAAEEGEGLAEAVEEGMVRRLREARKPRRRRPLRSAAQRQSSARRLGTAPSSSTGWKGKPCKQSRGGA